MKKIVNIFGPNLNMLGYRDPKNYGGLTFKQLKQVIKNYDKDFEIISFQSNVEGEIIDFIHNLIKENDTQIQAVICNFGAFSHYSYAIMDACEILANYYEIIEVHLSDVTNREDFRKFSILNNLATKSFYGKKEQSYFDAINWIKVNRREE